MNESSLSPQSQSQQPMRLGDLLVAAGLISEEDLKRALDYGRKTALPLGRVLIMLRCVSDEELQSVLHAQSLMKYEGLPNEIALQALAAARKSGSTFQDALKKLNWQTNKYREGEEPELIAAVRSRAAKVESELGADHVEIARPLMELADLYMEFDSYSQSEATYLRALKVLEKRHGAVHLNVASCLWRIGSL